MRWKVLVREIITYSIYQLCLLAPLKIWKFTGDTENPSNSSFTCTRNPFAVSLSLSWALPLQSTGGWKVQAGWRVQLHPRFIPRREGWWRRENEWTLLWTSSKLWPQHPEVSPAGPVFTLIVLVLSPWWCTPGPKSQISAVVSFLLFPFSGASWLQALCHSHLTKLVAKGHWHRQILFLWRYPAAYTRKIQRVGFEPRARRTL